ncbi:hypothetical protein FOZ63_024130 [Perkinsus olseni]|uniref:Uncharacterized protein n=1 Tax=Perkinsus olseni TaxID=32597 RepID=A0A7J6TCG4_PEROL|nr:hypothetical protein FOZ62_010821 [Perkinsus olseni]KAF4742442.1 hypothetical protein FOZ63_024130 [Perkinsus olseni]
MAMNIPAIFGFIGLLVGCRADKLVRLAISQDRALPGLLTTERLFARLNVDNEDVKWYETKMKGDCDKLIFKCYECNPALCKEGPVWTSPVTAGLKFVKIVHEEDQSIMISGYYVGDMSQDPIMLSVTPHFNMMDSFIQLPIDLLKEIITLLTTQGTKHLAIYEQDSFLRISCDDSKYLPSLTFLLKGSELETVPPEIQPASYTIRLPTKMCILRIEFRADGTGSLGLPALIGFYHLSDWNRSRIGTAEVK